MTAQNENVCLHCGKRIVLVNFALGEKWVHQPAGAAFQDGQYEHCKITIAEEKVITDVLKPCPTCQGMFWDVRLGRWIKTRETSGMVCQTCGRDYGV